MPGKKSFPDSKNVARFSRHGCDSRIIGGILVCRRTQRDQISAGPLTAFVQRRMATRLLARAGHWARRE